jgi:cytochrome c-type biogenesis protein CcmH/NrfG
VKREPMVFFVAGMVFGCVLGYMLTNLGGGDAPRPVALGEPSPGARTPAEPARGGTAASPSAPDPNEVTALESLAKRDKNDARSRVQLGNLYMDHSRFEDAIRWYQEALRLEPGKADVLVDMGACYVNMGKPEEGLKRFDEVLKKEPGHKKALFNKGVAFMESGRPRDAVAIWEDLLKRYPDDPQLAGLKDQIEQVRSRGSSS